MSVSTGRRYARRASVVRIVVAHAASLRAVRDGRHDEDPPAARRVARPVALNGPAICTCSMSGSPFMFCMSRSRVNGCSGSTDFGGVLLDERDADDPRTGLDGHARAQALVERVLRQRQVRVRQLVVFFAADRRGEHALAVDGDLEPWGHSSPVT